MSGLLPVLIGSRAVSFEGIYLRYSPDTDIVMSHDQVGELVMPLGPQSIRLIDDGTKYLATFPHSRGAGGRHPVEIEIADEGTSGRMLQQMAHDFTWEVYQLEIVRGVQIEVALPPLNLLYMMKMAHRYKKNSRHFLKTMGDIRTMRQRGAEWNDRYHNFFELRQSEAYSYSHPNLNVTKGEFFSAQGDIRYVYDHDSIHEAVAIGPSPAYTLFKDDQAQVFCSREKFEALPLNVRLSAVVEESYVLAIERSLVTHPGGMTPKEAFDMALMKVCTSITSGWFREFAWENYDNVQKMYADLPCFWARFQAAATIGWVKLAL